MDLARRKELRDPWTPQGESSLLSPSLDKHWEQIVLFPDCDVNDYAVEFELTLHGGVNDVREAGVIVRHSGEDQYYYAGIGGFGGRTFIGMVERQRGERVWSCFAREGSRDDVELNRPYRLRVECRGSKLSVYVDDRNRLSVEADTFPTGCWGLRTVSTQALFANLRVRGPSVLKAFVVMPFTPSLNFVYEFLRDVVVEEGLECHRIDESKVPVPIIDDIKKWLANADLIIADLTSKNPNVYYEAGYAHALNKKVLLMAQSTTDLAFNVGFIRTLIYSSPENLRDQLKKAIAEMLEGERGRGQVTP